MKRMITNAERLQALASEINYNAETNTLEIGGNVYVDGEIKPSFEKTFTDGSFIKIFELYKNVNSYAQDTMFCLGIVHDETTGCDYYGIGCLTTEQDGLYMLCYDYESDEIHLIGVNFANTESLSYDIDSKMADTSKIPTYYEHQLTLSTAAVSFYINYYSTRNLVIDSLQDLTAVVKPNNDTKLGLGSTYAKYENRVWKLASGDLITTVSDNVVVVD